MRSERYSYSHSFMKNVPVFPPMLPHRRSIVFHHSAVKSGSLLFSLFHRIHENKLSSGIFRILILAINTYTISGQIFTEETQLSSKIEIPHHLLISICVHHFCSQAMYERMTRNYVTKRQQICHSGLRTLRQRIVSISVQKRISFHHFPKQRISVKSI